MKTTGWLLAAGACAAGAGLAERPVARAAGGLSRAVAVLRPAPDGKVEGTITFHRVTAGVHVLGRLSGLAPGAHGFHIHEFGDCSAPDFTSAGAHFNPSNHPHGRREDPKRHVGDLGNVEAGPDGVATLDYEDRELRFEGLRGILGRGVIVHTNPDDFKTQPTGNAGGRLACGVIGVAKPE